MRAFAQVAQAISQRPGTNEKAAILAEYLRELDDADLAAAVRFFTGNPFAASDRRTLSVGGSALVKVARRLWQFDDAALSAAYARYGDLGDALGSLVRQPHDAPLFAPVELGPASLSAAFASIAQASGKNSAKRREALLEDVFRATGDSLAWDTS